MKITKKKVMQSIKDMTKLEEVWCGAYWSPNAGFKQNIINTRILLEELLMRGGDDDKVLKVKWKDK